MLEHAAAVLDARAEAYWPANASFRAIATRWSLTLGQPVTPAQVALCMIDLKMVRLARYSGHCDSLVEIIIGCSAP